jgi:hypothetical protein
VWRHNSVLFLYLCVLNVLQTKEAPSFMMKKVNFVQSRFVMLNFGLMWHKN